MLHFLPLHCCWQLVPQDEGMASATETKHGLPMKTYGSLTACPCRGYYGYPAALNLTPTVLPEAAVTQQ